MEATQSKEEYLTPSSARISAIIGKKTQTVITVIECDRKN